MLLAADPRDARAGAQRTKVAAWLRQRGVERVTSAARADLAIVLGGDGTFLRTARQLEKAKVALIGLRLGTFGFLAELEPDRWERDLERLLQGKGKVESWLRLHCRILRPGARPRKLGLAVNDIVLTADKVARLVQVVLRIDGQDVSRFRGDGIIVATPVGSTAHSLAAGGPILEPTARSLLMTPLASQALTYRPLVLQASRRIELVVVGSRSGTSLTMDGQVTVALSPGTVVEVSDSGQDLKVASVGRRSRFLTLRDRLRWGEPLIDGG